MDVFTIDEMVYTMEYPKEDRLMIKEYDDKLEIIMTDIANRLLSLVTMTYRTEHIQLWYQNRLPTEFIAQQMKKKLKNICTENFKENGEKDDAPPVHFLLLFRGMDMVTPFMRNNTYSGVFYDLLKRQEIEEEEDRLKKEKEEGTGDGTVEFNEKFPNKMKYTIDTKVGETMERICQLNEEDNIWQRYKYRSFQKISHFLLFSLYFKKQNII